ncbi:ABC transporter ATP-binding protein [uncultured Thermanaerothrix sp.]|uniref:energy-coupling factor ABC transporter ATP-binding protein n=1 Tax=uncultured Thermanaerothrix sp. TaxID=1195149 RepID=UPI002620A1D8|nr:ABC transporter ATP-binding protein [uncultured Thermanaerothrix sp.]
MAVIVIKNLTYTYPTMDHPALREVSLEVEAGEFVAIIGPNGAGKSTLCYTLAGFVPHFFKGELQGDVYVAGQDIRHVRLEDWVLKVGLVFQNPFNQISGAKFTVYEEIAFGLENIGVPREEMKRRVEEVMALTGIADLADRSPYALSGGQQQRVALASILVMQPEVLVLDEPTSQLDPIGSREVFQVIRQLAHQGVTIVMAEHKVEWIAQYADRVIALAEGEIIASGQPAEVLTDPRLPEYGIGISRYTAVARQAAEEGLWPPHQRLPVTLEEAAAGFRAIEETDYARLR